MSWIENPGASYFSGYNISQLEMDEAWINITNKFMESLWIYQLVQECYKCPYTPLFLNSVLPTNQITFKANTKYPFKLRFRTKYDDFVVEDRHDPFEYCTVDEKYGEFGIYEITTTENSKSCQFHVVKEPVNIYLPILLVIFFLIGIWAIRIFFTFYTRRRDKAKISEASSSSIQEMSTKAKSRLRSLDTFRGICIVIMIFVNDGGGGYYFNGHATWDGLYIADLVFPWFLWIMGVCIPIAVQSQLKRGTEKKDMLKRIFIRSCKLVGIGLILNSKAGPVDLKGFRIPGVLQRFGLCYVVAASSCVFSLDKETLTFNDPGIFHDIFLLWKGWIIALLFLLVHTCVVFFLPVDGCPTGYLGPGGLHDGNQHPGYCIGGATGLIDQKILTSNHIFQYPTTKTIYRSDSFDPEGLWGTLTAIFQVWMGVQTGMTLSVYKAPKSRIIRWTIWALLMGAIGTLLCGGQQTGWGIPINKNLWSLSFVMVTTCFALISLTALYILVDIKKWWSGTPFYEPGMNSIFLYVGHSVANVLLPWHFRFGNFRTHFIFLVEAVWGTALWVLIAIHLDAIKWYWSL